MSQIVDSIVTLIDKVEEGTGDPLEILIELKRIEKTVKDGINQIKDVAMTEADKYGKGEHEAFGAVFQRKSGGGRWDYSKLDWMKDFTEKQKSAQQAAKMAEKSQTLIDEETGEVVQPASFKSNADTIQITIKQW